MHDRPSKNFPHTSFDQHAKFGVSDINSNLKIYFCEVPKVWGTLGPVPLEWGMADPLEIQYFPTLLFLKKLLAYFYGHGVVPVINFFVCIRQLYSS